MKKNRSGALDAASVERLALLMEEMGEAQQVAGKILRHGWHSTHPRGGPVNAELLEEELGHVLFAIRLLAVNGEQDWERIGIHSDAKIERVKPYLHRRHKFPEECRG